MLASVGHGGIKEGQIINKMVEEKAKFAKKHVSDSDIIEGIAAESYKANETVDKNKSKSGIVVRGMHDLAVRFSRCCSPVPGDEIVGFVTRGRGVSIHRTDCINIISLPEEERVRLIPAEWQNTEEDALIGKYQVEIKIYANNRIGMFVDISKVFTEKGIDIKSVNTRVNKQGLATVVMQFETKGTRELHTLCEKIRQIPGVIDIERTSS